MHGIFLFGPIHGLKKNGNARIRNTAAQITRALGGVSSFFFVSEAGEDDSHSMICHSLLIYLLIISR